MKSLRRSLQRNRKADADASNVTTASTHSLSGRDSASVRLPDKTKSSLTDTDPNYIYYRIYAEDGAIPTKTSVSPGDPFLGRIKAISVPPPHTVKAVKHSIAKLENIKDRTKTSLFLTLYSESPIGDAEKVTIRNRTSLGSTPQEPLALVAKMSDTERRALEYEVTSAPELEPTRITELEPARITEIYWDKAAEVAEPYWDNLKAVEPEAPEPEVAEPALPAWARAEPARAITAEPASATATPEIRYLYYLLYADDYEISSLVAIDSDKPSLGRIRVDSIAPPHSPASIKLCISRVERTPALAHANLFADTSCDTPLKERHISFLHTDGPGLSKNEPMAIVQKAIVQIGSNALDHRSSRIPKGAPGFKKKKRGRFWM